MDALKINISRVACLCFCCVVALSITVHAQDEKLLKPRVLSSEAPALRFEHMGVANGLMQGSANDIMQDREGYIWITTQSGLHRYDGQEFKVYTSIPFDTTSLSESWVWTATEAQNGDLWVTTQGNGLNRLDRAKETFTHYKHDPADSTSLSSDFPFMALEDRHGDLWVSTFDSGLNRMHAGADGVFEHYRHEPNNPNSLTSDELYSVDEDSSGYIWVSSANGLNRIDPETNKITRFLYDPDKSKNNNNPSQIIFRLYFPPDESNILWLASGDGLIQLNSKTGEDKQFLIAPDKNGFNPQNVLYQVTPDPVDANILWVGGPGTGIARFDIQNESFTSYRHDPRDSHSLSENYVQSVFTDRSGTIWAGTSTEGINKFNPGAVNFTHIRNNPENEESLAPGIVWGIYEDRAGRLWISSNDGPTKNYLTEFDTENSTVKRYRYDPNNDSTLLPGTLREFAEDQEGHFWIAGSGGLNLFNPNTGRVKRFIQKGEPESPRRNNLFTALPVSTDSSKLWLSSLGGIDRFDSKTGRFTHIPLTPHKEQEPAVFSLYQDAENVLWAGSTDGIIRITPDGKSEVASAYDPNDTTTISENQIVDINVRPQEPAILWLATQSGGLDRFDTRTGIATHFMMKDGLPSNTLYAILVDEQGTLWISTNNGISNFDPETETFRNYGLDDGLMALEYNQNAYAKGKSGAFYFGSGKGVTAFIPEQLHINEIPPQVVISGLKLYNKPVKVGPDSPLTQPLSKSHKITLAHDQNELTFDFIALHYANAAKNKYAYKLDGFDQDWIDAGTKRSATYTNLPPGNYKFHVKAANADGIWSDKDTSIQLAVLAPWYSTWWAYGLFIGMLGFMIFGVDRVQRRRLSKKERERTVLREAELRAEAENKRRSDTEKLSKIGRTITSTLSVNEIIDTVYEHVNALMDATIFGVGIYNSESRCLEFPATKENGTMLPAYLNRLDEEDRLAVLCFKNNEEIIIGDYIQEREGYIKSYKPPIHGKEATSIIYLPLVQQDHVIGVITTQSYEKDAYTEYHVNLLRNLATYAAIALDNAAAYRKLNATLSELQSMQQQLVQQEKLASLGQLTAGIAHEIKNPLNFVNNFSDLSIELIEEIRDEMNGVEKSEAAVEVRNILNDVEANLKKILEHGRRADAIVKSMLLHSRGKSGEKVPTDLNKLLDEYTKLAYHGMRATNKSFNVDIQTDFDTSLKTMDLVAQDLSRGFLNIINNGMYAAYEYSREFADRQPVIKVQTREMDNKIEVRIRDNGPGIPNEIREKIFEPFFTTKPTGEGTGLGLSMTYDIINLHKGSLQIETEPGAFTEFIITLPKPNIS